MRFPSKTYCAGRIWAVQRCSSSHMAVCVNCAVPCLQDELETFINPCSPKPLLTGNSIHVLSFQFNYSVTGPVVSNIEVTPSRTSASIRTDVNRAGTVYCRAYPQPLPSNPQVSIQDIILSGFAAQSTVDAQTNSFQANVDVKGNKCNRAY